MHHFTPTKLAMVKKMGNRTGMVAQAFNPRTSPALESQRPVDLCKFKDNQDSHGYVESLGLKKMKRSKENRSRIPNL